MITASAPGKIHLLGEHSVVYGKPALLAAIGLKAKVSISDHLKKANPTSQLAAVFKPVIEPVIKNRFKMDKLPDYQAQISCQIPLGAGLGSSAAISAAYIAALLTYLKIKWGKALLNALTFEAEKVFHGQPSGADNSTVVYGGLVWFEKQTGPRILDCAIPAPTANKFAIINTGKPKETTRQMVEIVSVKCNPSVSLGTRVQSAKFKKIFEDQEKLVKNLLAALKSSDEKQIIQIIKGGENNLEKMGVVSKFVQSIIRQIEKAGGAAKICGGGGISHATGALLCYHPQPEIICAIAKSYQLPYFKTALGVEGLHFN